MTVEDVVKRYGGKMRGNRGGWLTTCMYPEHDDSTPSMSVNAEGLFYCWGCRRKGNFARLLHDIAGWSWPKAIAHADVVLQQQAFQRRDIDKLLRPSHIPDSYSRGLLGLYDCDWEEAWHRYQQALRDGDEHRPPWSLPFDRGFTHQTLTHFQAGYDADFERITVPLFAERDKFVGLIGRTCVGHDIKYYVYPGTLPSKHVYNLYAPPKVMRKDQDFLLLVEGPWDAWMLYQKTGYWAVALMTTRMSAEQMYRLCRVSRKFILMFDDDPAGRRGAMETSQALLTASCKIDLAMPRNRADLKSLSRQQLETLIRECKPFPAPSALAQLRGEGVSHAAQLGRYKEGD